MFRLFRTMDSGGARVNNPFELEGRFWKGNFHTHSTRSDGTREPADVIEQYRSRGYDFLSLTDHFLPAKHFGREEAGFITVSDTTDLGSDDFLTILGAEIHAPALTTGDMWHFVAVGLPLDFAPLDPEERGIDIARRAHEAGAYVAFAHPAWYAQTIEESLPILPYIHGIEIWNTGCTVISREDGWHFADQMYALGHQLSAYAADDAHFKDPRGPFADAFGGWVHVKAPALESGAILDALKAGEFYSSSGPEILDLRLDDDALRVKTSPVQTYLVSGTGSKFARKFGEPLTEAEFPLRKPDGSLFPWASNNYFRFTATAEDGTRAWSNPIWLDGLN
jgi:hypothetical protein